MNFSIDLITNLINYLISIFIFSFSIFKIALN